MSKDETQNATPTDETPTDVTPTGETPTQAGTGETPATTTTATTTPEEHLAPDEHAQEIEKLKTALKKANAEAAAHRVKANELDKLKADIEAEKLTEKERLEKKIAELQKASDEATRAAQEYRVTSELRVQALQLGFADANDATRLLDHAEIEYGEDGTPTNVGDLLKALLKTKPYLAAAPAKTSQPAPNPGGATNPPRSQTSQPTALSWETISKMKPDEYAARQPEIQAWIAQNPARRGQR